MSDPGRVKPTPPSFDQPQTYSKVNAGDTIILEI